MNFILNILVTSLEAVWLSLLHNWPYLLLGIVISAVLKLAIDAEKISGFLRRFRGAGIAAATGVAVATPLCSCGTTAVVLGMMASTMPWAPIVAFMVASPLTSPEGLVYSAGLFGWPFATTFFVSSILLGLAGGAAAVVIEKWGWLANQTRFAPQAADAIAGRSHPQPAAGCGCANQAVPNLSSSPIPVCACTQPIQLLPGELSLASYSSIQPVNRCACSTVAAVAIMDLPQPTYRSVIERAARSISAINLDVFLKEVYNGGKRLLPMYLGFAFMGFFLNGLIPANWVATLFGSGNFYSVPLAATLGLPLYINGEASLPLVRALLESGMSQGAALAFLISGAGTSIGAMGGALTIARWRVVALVVSVLWIGAILSGSTFDLLLSLGLF
jgi:uncharacterized membrane protein YraQ (UPF0718 family)